MYKDIDPLLVATRMKERSKVHGRIAIPVGSIIAYSCMDAEGLLAFDLSPLKLFLNALFIAFWSPDIGRGGGTSNSRRRQATTGNSSSRQ
jgi:hypothetical protein